MPKYSVFTPTHRPTYLAAVYGSLVSQTDTDWEWVVVQNNGCNAGNALWNTDKRVRSQNIQSRSSTSSMTTIRKV